MWFSCNVVSRWYQLVSFLNCLQDVKLSRIAICRDECRRMNCRLNWSFISCGELHCDSVKIKTMINSSLFFLRQCESLDWSDWLFCYCRLLISGRAVTRVWIRWCFSFSQCFRKGVFSSLSPPPPRSLDSPHFLLSSGSFNMAHSKKTPVLQATIGDP